MATLREVPAIMATNSCDAPDAAFYEFIVRDNGRGIKKSELSNIFLPFECIGYKNEIDDAQSLNNKGAGLGLPIAKKLANMLGGDITCESVLNGGSVFTATMCLKTQTKREVDLSKLRGLRVVVTDDDEASRANTVSLLIDMGMHVSYCNDCKNCKDCSGAIDVIKREQNNPNGTFAIISNYTPLERDGLRAIKLIREAANNTPLILYSSCNTASITMDTREAGVDIVLEKPLFKSKLALSFYGLLQDPRGQAINLNTPQNKHYKGKRILLVDDNDLNRDVACEILLMMGLQTDVAINGQDAIDKFTGHKAGYYDLIFMDIQMPLVNGYEAAKKIRSLKKPDSATIPIVAMSANAFNEDIKKSLESGMNAHIAKPLDLKRLREVLKKWL